MKLTVMEKFHLPRIPGCKIPYEGKKTLEIDAIFRSQNGEPLSNTDIQVLAEVVRYYEELFPILKRIDLTVLSLDEALEIQKYLDEAVNYTLLIRNDMSFNEIYRVTIIDDSFREKEKVRDTKYLKYPPINLIRSNRKYNRANTFNKTVFYAASHAHIAIRETKPRPGDKIIISAWAPLATTELFNSYPIYNGQSNTTEDYKSSINETSRHHHQLHNKLSHLLMDFLVSEFQKEVESSNPHRLEYLFSAYFSEQILGPILSDTPAEECDLICYPTMAFEHKLENIAMNPHCLDQRMKIVRATEYEVEDTSFNHVLPLEIMPAKLRFIRNATWFEEDYIIWDDE